MTFRIAEAVSEHIVELSQTHLAEKIASYKTLGHANDALNNLTGIRHFFDNLQEFQEFRRLIMLPAQAFDSQKKREWGDFQTPPELATRVCQYLVETGVSPATIVEPTYGMGNFILAALRSFPAVELIYGVEVQERYKWQLKIALLIKALMGRCISTEIELHQDNIFTHIFPGKVAKAQSILVIGNPPWVTSAELGALESDNLPEKQNIRTLSGMDALTGKSNFDISEYILLRLLDSFSQCRGTLAMLCKTSTAKNIVEILPKKQFKVLNIRTLEINASRDFGVAVEACLLVMELGHPASERTCKVATLEDPKHISRVFGWVGDKFVSNVKNYELNSDLDSESELVWRQGLKHDCARIMELSVVKGTLRNGNDEIVNVEKKHLYWLAKSSDLRSFEMNIPRKMVVVTQNHLNEDTSNLEISAPKLWKYLVRNSQHFEKRKSSIYRNKPRFSIFGVGEYSFKKYKVAVSGLYKELIFSLVCPVNTRPVMLDDTCYFLGFDSYLEALFTASLFNSARVKQFLYSIAFMDAKRPYTKAILMRLNVAHAIQRLSLQSLVEIWDSVDYQPQVSVTEADFENYRRSFLNTGVGQESLQLTFSATD